MRLCLIALLFISSTVSCRRGGGGYHGGSRSHSYPHSTGYSGTGTGGSHTYPSSTGLSGNSNGYNTRNTYYQHNSARYNYGSKTEVYHHYHYSPPQQISYGSTYHPVYHGTPPVYVYEYRNSGSRFDTLLTGLALYNLGRMSAGSHHYNGYDSHREYRGAPGEICKLGISKRTGEYEETRIDCKLMSSFIWEASPLHGQQQQVVSSNTVTTTFTNVTQNANGTGNGANTSVTTVKVEKNEVITDALQAKGPSIAVTPGMTCFMIRISRDTSILKKNVDCGLLQEYAQRSLRSHASVHVIPIVIIVLNFSLILLRNYLF